MAVNQSITSFKRGLRGDLDVTMLPVGAASALTNVLFDRGGMRVRPGITRRYQLDGAVAGTRVGPRAFTEYHNSAYTVPYRLLSVSGTALLMSGPDGTFQTPITTITSVGATATATCTAAHGLPVTATPSVYIHITGASIANYNGRFHCTPTSTTEFTYTIVAAANPTGPYTYTVETKAIGATDTLRFAQYQSALYAVDGSNQVSMGLYSNTAPATMKDIDAGDAAGYVSIPAYTALVTGNIPAPPAASYYTIMYTIAQLQPDNSYLESVQSYEYAFTTTTPAAWVGNKGLSFTVPEPAGLTVNDKIRVYLRTSVSTIAIVGPGFISTGGPFYKMTEVACTGSAGNIAVVLTEPPTYLEATYNHVSMRPPDGQSLIASFGGRMWYAKGDVLSVSNLNAPGLVPQDYTANATANLGGYATVGTDGGAITALVPFGSSMMIFKKRGIWRAVGDCGNPDFYIEAISTERGALVQEGVCAVEGNLLVWTESKSVWAWDGSRFFEIGRPIAPTWKALAAQTESALVYDPAYRQVILLLKGSAAVNTTLNSIALVCDVSEPIGTLEEDPDTPLFSWTQYDNVPVRCARYLNYAPYPGLYAADLGISATYKTGIFQLNAAEVTGDDGFITSGNSIAYNWLSGYLYGPSGQQYKILKKITATIAPSVPLTNVSVIVTLDGSGTTATSTTLTATTGQFQYVWYPACTADCISYQIRLAGTTAVGGQLLALLVELGGRGNVR